MLSWLTSSSDPYSLSIAKALSPTMFIPEFSSVTRNDFLLSLFFSFFFLLFRGVQHILVSVYITSVKLSFHARLSPTWQLVMIRKGLARSSGFQEGFSIDPRESRTFLKVLAHCKGRQREPHAFQLLPSLWFAIIFSNKHAQTAPIGGNLPDFLIFSYIIHNVYLHHLSHFFDTDPLALLRFFWWTA